MNTLLNADFGCWNKFPDDDRGSLENDCCDTGVSECADAVVVFFFLRPNIPIVDVVGVGG